LAGALVGEIVEPPLLAHPASAVSPPSLPAVGVEPPGGLSKQNIGARQQEIRRAAQDWYVGSRASAITHVTHEIIGLFALFGGLAFRLVSRMWLQLVSGNGYTCEESYVPRVRVVDWLLLVVGVAVSGLLLLLAYDATVRRAMSSRYRSLNLRALPTRRSPSRKTAGYRSSGAAGRLRANARKVWQSVSLSSAKLDQSWRQICWRFRFVALRRQLSAIICDKAKAI
jgi:hypothetical protein